MASYMYLIQLEAFLSLLEQQYEQNVSKYNIISKMIHFTQNQEQLMKVTTQEGVEIHTFNTSILFWIFFLCQGYIIIDNAWFQVCKMNSIPYFKWKHA